MDKIEKTNTEIVPESQTAQTPQNQSLAPVEAQAVALSVTNVWADKEAFNQMLRVSQMLSQSSLVPQNYQGKPQDCFIAVEMAARMNTSPIFIMQNLYVVKGKPSWAGQACMAMINACGKFANVRHIYTGKKGEANRGCYVAATRLSDGQEVTGTEVTLAMAQAEGWTSNSKWRNMPEQMLGYRAASFFARMYCPEALMGLQTRDEIIDADPIPERAADLTAALKAETPNETPNNETE